MVDEAHRLKNHESALYQVRNIECWCHTLESQTPEVTSCESPLGGEAHRLKKHESAVCQVRNEGY